MNYGDDGVFGKIVFYEKGEQTFQMITDVYDKSHDVILSALNMLIHVLIIDGDQLDDDVIDGLKNRLDELRYQDDK